MERRGDVCCSVVNGSHHGSLGPSCYEAPKAWRPQNGGAMTAAMDVAAINCGRCHIEKCRQTRFLMSFLKFFLHPANGLVTFRGKRVHWQCIWYNKAVVKSYNLWMKTNRVLSPLVVIKAMIGLLIRGMRMMILTSRKTSSDDCSTSPTYLLLFCLFLKFFFFVTYFLNRLPCFSMAPAMPSAMVPWHF